MERSSGTEYKRVEKMQYGPDQTYTPAPPATDGSPGAPSRDRGGMAWMGVVLVVIGAIFLVAQLVPGIAWWTVWPAGIVVLGVAQMVTPGRMGWSIERVSDGIGTVVLGLFLLGNTTGYISWAAWGTLLALWPVLLISAGIGLLGKAADQSWLRALAPVVIWLAMAYAAAMWWNGAPLPVELPFTLPSGFTIEL